LFVPEQQLQEPNLLFALGSVPSHIGLHHTFRGEFFTLLSAYLALLRRFIYVFIGFTFLLLITNVR
jgi:hypothetical protein